MHGAEAELLRHRRPRPRVALTGLLLSMALTACGPADIASGTPAPAEALATLQAASPSAITPEQVGDTFALGGNATDVQRDLLREQLVGATVEWRLVVYDVSFADGLYTVTSQPLGASTQDAVQVLRIVAAITPRTEADHARLRAVKTNEVLHVRATVSDITLRTVVWLTPATLAP